jgi:hypothetical protein
MCLDEEHRVIYVFGGRTLGNPNNESIYSGLYQYDIEKNKWKLLRYIIILCSQFIKICLIILLLFRADNAGQSDHIQLRSRIGHSMIFNPYRNELYMFAGQRNKDYLR